MITASRQPGTVQRETPYTPYTTLTTHIHCVGYRCGRLRRFKKLHFRNATGGITNTYPLRVTAAPEPSNVIYENLAISRRQKCARRFISFIAMLVCSVVV